MDYEFVKGQFTEAQLEAAIIEIFQQQDYIYVHGEKIHWQYEDILLEEDLRSFLQGRYAHEGLSETETRKIINQLALIPASPLYEGNRAAFWLVNEGFDLQRDDLSKVALHIDYIDFDHPENNIFKVVNQYSVQGERLRRPDLLVFINGIPVAIFEFKSAINEDANAHDAWEQITIRYTRDIPKLMKYCFLSVISDGANTKMGSIFTPYPYYYAWNKANEQDKVSNGVSSLFTVLLQKSASFVCCAILCFIQTIARKARLLFAVIPSFSEPTKCWKILSGISGQKEMVKVARILVQRDAAKLILCYFCRG